MLYNSYSDELKTLIATTKDPFFGTDINIPKSTTRYWIKNHSPSNDSNLKLKIKIRDLENQARKMELKLKALSTTFEEYVPDMGKSFVPKAESKERILKAINQATEFLSLNEVLETTRISKSKYHRWRERKNNCCLEDYSRCPKISVAQLTQKEISKMKELFFDPNLSHFTLRTLSLYAQNIGQLYCSYQSWLKYTKKFGWRRPTEKIYRRRKLVGVQAKSPNQIWHMDVSIFKLPNSKPLYIQAVIDNYSKYVIGWNVSSHKRGSDSVKLIKDCFKGYNSLTSPTLYVDDGSENKSKQLDKLLLKKDIKKIIAQVDVHFSNSRVEVLFRSLKHNYLYKKSITSKKQLQEAVDFYVNEYNNRIPNVNFKGATPQQIYEGRWTEGDIEKRKQLMQLALSKRIQKNKSIQCKLKGVS